MGRLFGTDGVRGVAGDDLTAQLAMDLAVAAAAVLGSGSGSGSGAPGMRPVAVVGRDPRASGEFLAGALDTDFGVVLSASHNPAPDNGIKFFARGGVKLPDAIEDKIEARLE